MSGPGLFAGLTRPELMSRIRSRGNKKTELALIAILKKNHIKGWRRHADLPGRPDFIFRQQKLAVFVDGCFWHGCPRCYRRPRSNQAFWDAKVSNNRNRDRRVTRQLRHQGWRVIRVWEHSLRQPTPVLLRIRNALAVS